jgi:hypothetical protein
MPSSKPNLQLVINPEEYFHELVTNALGETRVHPRPETEFYLVHLLKQFITTDRLYPRDSEGQFKDEPLILLIKDALEAPEPQAQRSLLRYVGDLSLYTAGFFQESLSRKSIDVDYYVGLGGTAYRKVAEQIDESPQREVYDELAQGFAQFVDVLAHVSEKTTPRGEQDLLKLCEKYSRTGNERLAKLLKEAGIAPETLTEYSKKKIQ